ncbi:MAG: cation:proton antiporter, partial [Thermoplasmata archaeon]
TGAQFDFHQFLDLGLIGLALLLALIAAGGKVVAVYPFARLRWKAEPARAIALGMIPRGEIGLIIGAIGYSDGILDQTTLGVILLMSIVTTVVGAVLFRRVAGAMRPEPLASHASSGEQKPVGP